MPTCMNLTRLALSGLLESLKALLHICGFWSCLKNRRKGEKKEAKLFLHQSLHFFLLSDHLLCLEFSTTADVMFLADC